LGKVESEGTTLLQLPGQGANIEDSFPKGGNGSVNIRRGTLWGKKKMGKPSLGNKGKFIGVFKTLFRKGVVKGAF